MKKSTRNQASPKPSSQPESDREDKHEEREDREDEDDDEARTHHKGPDRTDAAVNP